MTSGYVFTLADDAISWKFVEQTIISRSTMEVEIIILDTTTSETEFLKNLLFDLPLLNKPIPSIYNTPYHRNEKWNNSAK